MFNLPSPKLIGILIICVLLCGMAFYIYRQSNTIKTLELTQDVLVAEKQNIQDKLDECSIASKAYVIDIQVLNDLIEKMDIDCAERVARESGKVKVIEKRTYITKKEAVDKGVLDEKSSQSLIEYFNTHIFN